MEALAAAGGLLRCCEQDGAVGCGVVLKPIGEEEEKVPGQRRPVPTC